MAEDLFGQRQASTHQHCRPDNCVKTSDVLADDVEISRPPFLEQILVSAVPNPGGIADQRIEPDIDDVLGSKGQRNAPQLSRTTDRDVLEASFEQSKDLVPSDIGFEKLRVITEVLQQAVAILRKLEEIVLLAEPLRSQVRMDLALPFDEILFLFEGFTRDAIPPFVESLVDVATLVTDLRELLHCRPMPRLRRPDEIIERDIQLFPNGPELLLHLIAVGERIHAALEGSPVDVLRVLVVAHQEMRLDSGESLVAGNDVRRDLFVRRTQMRTAIDVIDRCGEVEAH